MAKKGRRAWLVTWEDFGHKHWGLERRRIVTALPSNLRFETVRKIVAHLWVALSKLTVPERIRWGTGVQFRKSLEALTRKESAEEFYFGLKPFLYARKVSDLLVMEEDRAIKATWREPELWAEGSEALTRAEPKLVRRSELGQLVEHEEEAFKREH